MGLREVVTVARTGQSVEDSNGRPGDIVLKEGMDMGRSDEAGATGHEDVHGWGV